MPLKRPRKRYRPRSSRRNLSRGGYAEYRYDRFRLNSNGAFYGLSYYNRESRETLDRHAAALKLEGRYARGALSIRTRTHLGYVDDQLGGERTARFDELAASWKPHSQTSRYDADSYLLGVRYLSANDTTWIAEYYRNGTGYTELEMREFFSLVDAGLAQYQTTGIDTLLKRAAAASQSGYGRAHAMAATPICA